MSEKITFSAEDPDELDSKKGRKEKASDKDGRKFVVPLPVARNEKSEPKPDADAFQQAPKSFLDKIVGTNAEKLDTTLASSEVGVSHKETDHESAVDQELQAEDASVEAIIIEQAEQGVAEDLHGGEEISLRELAQVPLERDEYIVEEALKMDADTEAEVAPELEAAEELPVVPETLQPEFEPTHTYKAEAEQQPIVAVLPPVPIQRPTYQSRSYRGRPGATNTTIPPVTSSVPLNGPGSMPPSVSGGGYNPNYANYASTYGSGSSPNTAPATPNVRKNLDDAEWAGRQQGRREGVLAGLLVGGGIEHFRHKRREKKMEKRQKKELLAQQKRAEKLEYDYESAKQKQKTEQTRSAANFTQERLATAAEKTTQAKELEELKKNQERLAAQQAGEAKRSEEELLAAVPKDHHIEQSAWHNIEVDKHGRAVQESAIDYGHEYYKERAHEVGPQQQVGSAAGEVALVAAALSESAEHTTTPSAPLGSSITAPKTNAPGAKTATQKVFRTISTPPSTPLATVIWLAVLIVMAAIIVTVAR